jgi:hypothetical protein
MSLLPEEDVISKARAKYISYDLASDIAPDIKAIAKEFGIEYPLLNQIAKRQNWGRFRRINRNKFMETFKEAQDTELARAAIDIAKVQADMLRSSLSMINTDIPKIHKEIMDRIENGELDSKSLVAVFKIMLDLKKQTHDLLLETSKEIQKDNAEILEGSTELSNLGLNSRVLDIVRQKLKEEELTDIDNDNQEVEDEKRELFDKLDGEEE